MNRTPRSIDEALHRARVFQDEYTTADLENARHNLARHLHELRWVQFLNATPHNGPRAHPLPAALHEQAAHDLRVLCRGTVRHHGAAARINTFNSRRDPDGALTFASLLYLADQDEGAQFWWHYAAGAGNVTAALCVYLLHLRHGDMNDATHWAGQISLLNLLGWDTYTPVAHHADTGHADLTHGPAVRYTLPSPGPTVSETAVKDAVDDLHTLHNGDLGPIPQPIPALVEHWNELVTS
ncbi:hypothetical protein ACIQAC_40485 [Streptomyces sp. NPDC088387]|uniref:hypothetical protein n=1 Tax=Streptomyces sp. NPDC088387 TaxID=3365859 RepID=UPI0037F1842F